MKNFIFALTLLSLSSYATTSDLRYFERPLNCPLRFSQLTNLRDQVQLLVSSLGKGCTQNGQQAINQLNSNVASLEGIATSFNTYNSSTDVTSSAQYAKNVSQVLGNINLITQNNSCFYDIKSRGTLPVLSDVIMSTSQLGLLIPSATGAMVAAGGYILGSSIKIIHELFKKRFNFDKPEERRAFLQLNCAFFDNRKTMEELGLFNPETEEFRETLIERLKLERVQLLKAQKNHDKNLEKLEATLQEAITEFPSAKERGLSPLLHRRYMEMANVLNKKPSDYAEKLRQVSFLAEKAGVILEETKSLKFNSSLESSRKLLLGNLEKILPDLEPNGRAWINNIDDYEQNFRGPLMAFLVPVAEGLNKELAMMEAELSVLNPEFAKRVSKLRSEIKEKQSMAWTFTLRLASLESKIVSLENRLSEGLFSHNDESSSNAVDILENYRKLQQSILGKEGRDYLKNAIKNAYHMQEGLDHQLELMKEAQTPKEKCSAAEKTRIAWAQYRYKVQEAHDFIATNLDLYRSSFRIGKEKLKRPARYVLSQMNSVQDVMDGGRPKKESVGELMMSVKLRMKDVETKLHESNCF